MVKFLVNWTHEDELAGGSETRHRYLAKVFPEAERVSVKSITGYSVSQIGVHAARVAVDTFLSEHTEGDDVVIKDAGVGGTRSIPAKTILIFGSPYHSLIFKGVCPIADPYWQALLAAQQEDAALADILVANSAFSEWDMKQSGITADCIVPNAVDTDFFTPADSYRSSALWLGGGDAVKGKVAVREVAETCGFTKELVCLNKDDHSSPEAIRSYYRTARLFLSTSSVEGNSNAVLEAMSCDTPVAVSNTGLFWDVCPFPAGVRLGHCQRAWDHPESYSPRKYVLENGYDLLTYAERMRSLV